MLTLKQAGPVIGCRFFTDSSLPTPYSGTYYESGWPVSAIIPYDQSFAAVYVKGVTGFAFGVVGTVADPCDRNEIFDVRNGVLSRFGSTNISNSDFHDFTGSILQNKSYLDSLDRDINQHAMHLFKANGDIFENTVDEVMVGFKSYNSMQKITGNVMDIPETAPVSTTRAIEVTNPMGTSIMVNTLTNGYLGIAVNGTIGSFEIIDNILHRSMDTRLNAGIDLLRIAFCDNPRTGTVLENIINITEGNAAVGINMMAGCSVVVRDNTINIGPDMGVGDNNAGISMTNVMQCQVNRNIIEASEDYTDHVDNSGIIITNSNNNSISCNAMTEMTRNLWIVGDNMETRVATNLFYNADVNLELFGPTSLGVQLNHRNKWYQGYDSYGAWISGPSEVVTASESQFICDASDAMSGFVLIPEDYGPMSVEGIWFIDEDGEGQECADPPFIDLTIPEDTLVSLVENDYDFTEYNDEMNWMKRANILSILLHFPDYLSNEDLEDFYETELSTPLGQLVYAQYLLQRPHGVDDESRDELDEDILYYARNLRALDSMILLNPVNITSLINTRKLTADTLQEYMSDWHGMVNYIETQSDSVYDAAKTLIAGVTHSNALENGFKKILNIHAKYLLGEQLSSTDTSQIMALAYFCPWEGGRFMPMAQMQYTMLFDSVLCHIPYPCTESSPFTSGLDLEVSPSLRVFPNPTQTSIHIVPSAGMYQLHVYSMQGGLISSVPVEDDVIIVDVSQYPSGLYYITGHNSVNTYIAKIVKQ
jgi:hypothetical protein